MEQLSHYSSKFKKQRFPITLVCDNVTDALNIGSLFRTADAFGISRLILCGKHIEINNKVLRTSRSTEKYVTYSIEEDIFEVIQKLKERDHTIIALEITSNSVSIHQMTFSVDKPIALVVGNENFGVSDSVLSLTNEVCHIEMFGQNSSMNVVQATNIALYEITKQLM